MPKEMKKGTQALKINPKKVCSKIESFIKENVRKFERDGVIVGLSGGIDSAVAAYLCARALGKERVFGLLMPERDSDPQSVLDAQLVAKKLGIKYRIEDLTTKLEQFSIYRGPARTKAVRKIKATIVRKMFAGYIKMTGETPFYTSLSGISIKKIGRPLARYFSAGISAFRIKHRLRMLMLYYYAEKKNLLVVGAANHSELLIGFFIKYGCDHATDIMPLLGLYKTQIRQLASYLGVPEKIIIKVPSPDMLPGLTDEFAIGLDYATLDLILYGLKKKFSSKVIAKKANANVKTINYVKSLISKSTHMREIPPWPKT